MSGSAEARPREDAALFESAFAFSGIGMALVSPDGRWLRVNQALCDIVGYSEKELLALSFQDITHPEDLDRDLALVHEMLARKRRTYQMEKRYVHKRGHHIWIRLTVSLVWREDGEPRHFISQIEDVTERRVVEERFRSAFYGDTAGVAIVGIDGRVAGANPAMLALLSHEAEADVVGRSWRQLTHPDDISAEEPSLGEMMAGRIASYRIEKRLLRRDGSPLRVEANVTLLRDREGRPQQVLVHVRDLTDRDRADQAERTGFLARRLVRRLLDGMTRGGASPQVRRDVGQRLAHEANPTSLAQGLATFEAMGLGSLGLREERGGRFTFEGKDSLDLDHGAGEPTCYLALGYLEGLVALVAGPDAGHALGTEMACQARGAAACSFVVASRPPADDRR